MHLPSHDNLLGSKKFSAKLKYNSLSNCRDISKITTLIAGKMSD